MPSMSVVERAFCRSRMWQLFARRAVLPWALQGNEPEGRLLEIGGGGGAMAEATVTAFPHLNVVATDIDPEMVADARRRLAALPQATVEQADVTALHYPEDSFDWFASYLMLHHVVQWEDAILEAARVLRPGGTMFGYDLTNTLLARAVHVVDRSPHWLVPPHDLGQALLGAGFVDVRVITGFAGSIMRFRATLPSGYATTR